MAGFQQAANALTGAPGQVMRSTGIYNELVGKNQELINELGSANEELNKKNEALDKKNKELDKKNEELRSTNMQLKETINVSSMMSQDYVRMSKMSGRIEAHERAVESRNKMLDIVYGPIEHKTAGPTGPKY